VNNDSEYQILRLKPKASRLFFPILVLAAVSFALAFVIEQISANDYNYALIAAGVILVLFWLVPMLSFLAGYLKLTNQRLVYRFGFLGFRKRKLDLADLSSIEIQTEGRLGRKIISILSVAGEEIRIGGYAKTKLLAAEIEALAKATI
jgi:protein involved in polysaccharide export with SLBB domain